MSDLWPSTSAPTVTVVPSTFEDDADVAASVDGSGVGAISYHGQGHTVTLTSGASPTYVKFPGRYAADSTQLPEWHFLVEDEDTAIADITLRARLSRKNAAGAIVVLADWFVVPDANTSAYNRSLAISSALAPDVSRVGGLYLLEFQADDGQGHQSRLDCAAGVGCVTWTQIILPPPLRQRAGDDGPVCSDLAVPTAHSLSTSSCGNTFAYTAVANLTDGRKVSYGFIDNPNPIPVQVQVSATAPATVRRGLVFRNIVVGSALLKNVCMSSDPDDRVPGPQLPDGHCFSPRGDTGEFGTEDVLDRDLATTVQVDGAAVVATNDQGQPIYEIPALSTATVWVRSDPWSFLLPGPAAFYTTIGDEQNLTATTGTHWLQCTKTRQAGPPTHPITVCSEASEMVETTFLTRVAVRAHSSVGLMARPSGSSDSTWAAATGTGIAGFNDHDFGWNTQMPGLSPL